jgi:hypothetical protein
MAELLFVMNREEYLLAEVMLKHTKYSARKDGNSG